MENKNIIVIHKLGLLTAEEAKKEYLNYMIKECGYDEFAVKNNDMPEVAGDFYVDELTKTLGLSATIFHKEMHKAGTIKVVGDFNWIQYDRFVLNEDNDLEGYDFVGIKIV